MPIANPDPVNASTSRGSAAKLTPSPSDEIPWLVSRTRKSRFAQWLGRRVVGRLGERLGGRL